MKRVKQMDTFARMKTEKTLKPVYGLEKPAFQIFSMAVHAAGLEINTSGF